MIAHETISILRRLLSKTDAIPETHDSTCWEWTGAKNANGYGIILIGGRPALAHRILKQITEGITLGNDDKVCHHCDNPGCVNPKHLFIGDQKANIQDMCRKGRLKTRNKLTPEQALKVIEMKETTGLSCEVIAKKFGVGRTCIWNIVNEGRKNISR